MRAYVAALRADNADSAYSLLAEDVRKTMTRAEFKARWATLAAERNAQANELDGRLARGNVPEYAKVIFRSGAAAELSFVDDQWQLEGDVTVVVRSRTPSEALDAFVRAIEARNYRSVMQLLAKSVQQTIERDVERRLAQLKTSLKNKQSIAVRGARATLQYSPEYKVELINENGNWRVLDFD
jgi:hypothetical protein